MSLACNNLTLIASSKLENKRRESTNVCYSRLLQSNFLRNFKPGLYDLNFKAFYSKRHHLDALLLVKFFKTKTNCYSVIHNIGLRVHTKQLRDFLPSTSVTSQEFSPSSRCATAGQKICVSLDFPVKYNITAEDGFSFVQPY